MQISGHEFAKKCYKEMNQWFKEYWKKDHTKYENSGFAYNEEELKQTLFTEANKALKTAMSLKMKELTHHVIP